MVYTCFVYIILEERKMHKNTIFILLLALVFFHTHTIIQRDVSSSPRIIISPIEIKPKPVEVIQYNFEQILNLIKIEDIKNFVSALSSKDFDGRGTGTHGNEKAATYICAHLDSLKIPYTKQSFTTRGVTTSNIIAHITPKNIKNNKIIVIGAHFDHLGSKGSAYYPGADDNASGVAALMSIATALSKYQDRLNHTVSLQFYSAEEWGLIGSSYYTNNPILPIEDPDISKHMAMINLDMIGYLRTKYSISENTTDYRNDKSRVLYNYNLATDLKHIVDKLSNKYPFGKHISGYKPGGSDHAPFYKKGVPIVFLHTGSHPHYHRTSDTPEKLNYQGLVCIARLALEILVEIDKDN